MSVDAGAWTSLANVREHLHIPASDTNDNTFIEHLINRSYKMLEQYIGRVMKAADYTEYHDGDGTNELILKQWPINSIASIHDDIERDFGSDTLVDAGDYVFEADYGMVRLFG